MDNNSSISTEKMVLTLVTFLTTLAIGTIIFLVSNLWFGIAVFSLLFGAYVLNALRKLKANPPEKGQVTRFEKRITGVFIEEGWNFIPFFPFYFGYIPIKVEQVPFEIMVTLLRTPDRAVSEVPILITFEPDENNLEQYINAGKEDGAKKQLEGKIQERIREWGMGDEEGPHDWVELNKSQLEATSILVKKIAGDSLEKIEPIEGQEVPTWIWLRYFTKPRPTKFLTNEYRWTKNDWEEVQTVLDKIKLAHGDKGLRQLERSVEQRKKQIVELRMGTGNIVLKDLGIILKRLNLGNIKVLGKVGEQAENEATEKQEREAEKLELDHVLDRISKFMEKPYEFTKEQALEIIQTERNKVVKTITEKKLSVGPETREMLEKIISSSATALLKAWAEKKEVNHDK